MRVIFRRTGQRRYAVELRPAAAAVRVLDPAPGFDEHIPHDLVHYVVEAELGLSAGVFGRAALGGGSFLPNAGGQSAREQARQRRKRQRKEASLQRSDRAMGEDMARSERLAAICDVRWRRSQGHEPDALRSPPAERLSPEEEASVTRVVARLQELAPKWHALPVGGELAFEWPSAALSPR